MPRRTPLALTVLLIAAGHGPIARGQTSYPMVMKVEPSAVRRGTTVEVTIACGGNGGGEVEGAFALLAQGPGLSGEILSAGPPEAPPAAAAKAKAKGRGPRRNRGVVKARLKVDADAPLGPREVRFAAPQGMSSVGPVVVVDDPVVAEADDKANDAPKGAQALTLPCVVSGLIGKTEDVDWYAVEAKAGQRLTFSAWANRLENKVHDLQAHFDPILQIHDADGRELAADDNHDFADPLLSFAFPKDGTYYLQIRDTTYAGNPNWTYALHATGGPVATAVSPLAVNPGARAELHAKGPNLDASEAIPFEAPAGLPDGPRLFALATSKGPTLPTPLVVTALPVAVEPDDDDAPAEPEKGRPATLPAALCGRLAAANDVDAYRFTAKKGQVYAFEAVARRAGAATDPTLKVVDAKGATQAEADDTPGLGKDARVEWTAAADGEFALVVADLHGRGGEEFGYVLLAGPAAPDFAVTCDPDKLGVGPGNRAALFVQVARRAGFSGPVTVDLGGLPVGVTASPLTIPAGLTQGVVVVSAAPDAKPAAALLSLDGRSDTPAGPVARAASPRQEIYMPGGGRGVYPVETLALAVTAPSDVTVEATPGAVTLEPGGKATIDVTVTRREGFDQPVNLDLLLRHLGGVHANPLPSGVTLVEDASKTLLGPKETKGKLVLQARPDAPPCENVPACALGNVSINFMVKVSYASAPVLVSVRRKP